MNDLTLQKARAYEAEHGAAISPAERPAYHMTPYVGWLNDPNGFSYYKGKYHQFYQYNPYDVRWAPMHWGHAVSTDLLHWEYLPCALAPDSPADNGPGCFSGSATQMDDGKQLLMYTSVVAEKQPNGEMRDIQTQSIAIGDGLNYEKPACNPVLTQKDLPEGFSRFDFRDPKIWRETDGTYSAVTVCLAEDGSGAAVLFQSKDGFDWHFVTVLERCNNQYGKMWECPDFFPLDGKQILMLGPMEMLPKGEFHNGHNVIAFIGSYDEVTHTFTRENVQQMDGGIDFYATQTTLAPDGRRLMTAWLQTWSDTEDKPQGCKWFGQTICPRELHIKDGRILQTPVRELDAVHGKRTLHENVTVQSETSLEGIKGRVADLTVTVQPGEYRSLTLNTAAAARRRPAFWVLLLHRADPQAVVLHIQPAVVARHALNRVASIAVFAVRYNDRRFKIKSGTRREAGAVHVVVVHGAVGADAVRAAAIRVRGAQAPADGGRRLVQIGDALCVVGEIAERLALRLPAAHARLRAGDGKALAVDRVQRRHLVALRHHNGDGDQALPDFLVQLQRPDAVTEVVQGAAEVTVFVVVAVGGVPCDLTESILADKGHARAGAVVVIVQLDELGGLAVFRQLHQAAVCQIGK